jgi:hypothetical protein
MGIYEDQKWRVNMQTPIVKPDDPKEKFDPADYVMIRGFPRPRENVKEVEKRYGAKLVLDSEPGLIRRLDTALFNAKQKTGEYPEFLAMPEDAANLYLPIPYPVTFFGMVLDMYNKPAWFRVKRHFVVGF